MRKLRTQMHWRMVGNLGYLCLPQAVLGAAMMGMALIGSRWSA